MKRHRKWLSWFVVLAFVLSLLPMKGNVAEATRETQWCVSSTSDSTIYAGQNIPIGAVDFEFVAEGLKIVIDLNDGVTLADVPENIKIDFRLTSELLERGSPGAYEFKTKSLVDPTYLLIPYASLASYLGVDESVLKSDGFQFNVFLHLDTIVNGETETAYPGDPGTGNPWVRYVTLTVEDCTPPPPEFDYGVYTIGFWKNIFNYEKVSFEYGSIVYIQGIAYDVSTLEGQQALSALMTSSSKSMTEEKRLIMQLTATKINVLLNDPSLLSLELIYKDSGVSTGLTVGELLSGAEVALSNKNIDQMKYYQKLLDQFNNGYFVNTLHD
ncbi:hypothetical protein EAT1b_1837 [Exiguobacterium sp. AT1b]|uniref:Uncharacterized protein n=1 Tax=Exiguobacterium sp. (strain ATCC BAA-1283 / AT1b) TaxID=360911 RepID=C4L0A0_EXISA|nr:MULTISPECIES: hypothetical protein [unclassified Exiguobacterium]ACQ70763.1 hypothetical protein EAT1b_1837 [Exiguobacterium sp. AT1b]